MRHALAGLLLLCTGAAHTAAPVLVVDLSEAYTRSTALAGLLAAVDQELQALAQRHRPELERLSAEMRELKQAGTGTRDRQLQLIRRINEIDTQAEREQERLSEANQRAIAEVDAAIAEVKKLLKSQLGAAAVLDIQETQYVRQDCDCMISDDLYRLLNERLPEVTLDLRLPGAGS
jgi:Skp family chaperone for outer membrane proteins